MKELKAICFSIFVSAKLFSQDIDVSGKWIGITTLTDGQVCSYEIELKQAGSELDGIINLSTFNRIYYSLYKIRGRLINNKVYVQGYEYIENKSGGGYNWCMASLNLGYFEKDNKAVLKGTWGGNSIVGGCPSVGGDVEVKKEKDKIVPKMDSIANRKITVKDSIEVSNVIIVIDVWDNGQEDGDIISLNLNGEWILRNHKVKKQKEQIKYALNEKQNYLILYAENLGSIPPNTAAIEINDGKLSKKIVLNSDLGKSEAILIKRK